MEPLVEPGGDGHPERSPLRVLHRADHQRLRPIDRARLHVVPSLAHLTQREREAVAVCDLRIPNGSKPRASKWPAVGTERVRISKSGDESIGSLTFRAVSRGLSSRAP